MWSFLSSILGGKANGENETNDCSSSSEGTEENDSNEEVFEDCSEEDPEVFSLQRCTAQKPVIPSIYPSLSTIAAEVVPSTSSWFRKQAEISSVNSVQHSESEPRHNAISTPELHFRPSYCWNLSEGASSGDLNYPRDSWDDASGSTFPGFNQGLDGPTLENGGDSTARSAHGSYSQVHRIPTAIPHGLTSADRGYSRSGPRRCAVSSFPRGVACVEPLSSPVVLHKRGSPANPCPGVVVRPSLWKHVKCWVRVGGSHVLHRVGEDWSSFNDLLATCQDDKAASPSPQSIIVHGTPVASFSSTSAAGGSLTVALYWLLAGTSGASFLEERSPSQTCCGPTPDILHSQISLGAFPLTNSPNCTVDRDSRQLSQLRFPHQCQGVNESSENTAFDPVSSFGNISLDPQSEERRQRQSHGGRSVQWPELTEHLSVLGKLDFPSKVFPILASLNGSRLEETFTLEQLNELRVPKGQCSQYLWTTKQPPERDAGSSSVFRCTVHRTGKVSFQIGVEKDQASTLLQRVLGFDRVLKVLFEDGNGRGGRLTATQTEAYHRLAENGIFAGLRRYQYFVHKLSEKSEKRSDGNVRCYFVCTESLADADLQDPQFRQFRTIADVRFLFMHIHTTESLSKYISRLQLVLSKTITVNLDWSLVNIEDIEDVRCKDASGQELEGICTDGTGYISLDLSKQIDTNIYNGRSMRKMSSTKMVEEEYSAIFQVRLFQAGVARKGTLAVNCELPPNTIRCCKSMVKVSRDHRMMNNSLTSLELVSTSHRTTGRANLSRDLIVLLSLCKVPESFFMKYLTAAMEKSYLIFSDPKAALDELLDWDDPKAGLLTDMISAKISLQEPFLHKCLSDMSKSRLQDFSNGRFPLDGTHYLIASADPTGTLKRNQVTITLSEGPIYCSKVLVYRAPGKHPGDIHIFQGTCNEQLEAAIGTSKYAIYFSIQGSRSITEEIGKGDLDGDLYWVCKNAEVISYFQEWHCRWEKTSKAATSMERPTDFSPEDLERKMFGEFLRARYEPFNVGKLPTRWLKHLDEHLNIKDEHSEKKRAHLEEALKLVSPCYDALDYQKTGIKPVEPVEECPARRPHHMGKQVVGVGVDAFSYESKSILGKIYDEAVSAEREWHLPSYDKFQVDVGFQIANYKLHLKRWKKHFTSYRGVMACAMEVKIAGSPKSTEPEKINLKYRQILYGGFSSFKDAEVYGTKERRLILEEASAIYTVVYETGKEYVSNGWQPRLSFAWNVAGDALCEIYSKKQPGISLHMSFDFYKEIYGRNKAKHQAPLSPEPFCSLNRTSNGETSQ